MVEAEKVKESSNTTKKGKVKNFNFLVFMASVLSLGSLIWTTYSLLDLFQGGGIDPVHMRREDFSPIGLSAAATADIAWTITMFAEFQGVRLNVNWWTDKTHNLLPFIGWIEVLFVAGLLAYHGSLVGNGASAFAAALPIVTKTSWFMALAGLKDPTDLTEAERLEIAETLRNSRLLRQKAEATSDQHAAQMEQRRREHEAILEERRAEAARKKLEQQTQYELEKDRLKSENELKALKQSMAAQLQIDSLRSQVDVEKMILDAQREIRLQAPLTRLVTGQVVSSPIRPELPVGEEEVDDEIASLMKHGLSAKEAVKAKFARRFYTAKASLGDGVTKRAFSDANNLNPPRLTEYTTIYPPEWFMERGLADWLTS